MLAFNTLLLLHLASGYKHVLDCVHRVTRARGQRQILGWAFHTIDRGKNLNRHSDQLHASASLPKQAFSAAVICEVSCQPKGRHEKGLHHSNVGNLSSQYDSILPWVEDCRDRCERRPQLVEGALEEQTAVLLSSPSEAFAYVNSFPHRTL